MRTFKEGHYVGDMSEQNGKSIVFSEILKFSSLNTSSALVSSTLSKEPKNQKNIG